MKRTIEIALFVMITVSTVSAAGAAETDAAERNDRVAFEKIVAGMQATDAEYARVLQAAMVQARAGNGEAPLDLQNQLITLRDARDRQWTRAAAIGLRHGWGMPGVNDSTTANQEAGQQVTPAKKDKASVFEGARILIKNSFEAEAAAIARIVKLPPVAVVEEET